MREQLLIQLGASVNRAPAARRRSERRRFSSARDDDGGGFIARDARAALEIATNLVCD
jgi:hypothetical protein